MRTLHVRKSVQNCTQKKTNAFSQPQNQTSPQVLKSTTSSCQQTHCQHVDGSIQQRTLTSVDGRNFILLDETSNVRPMPHEVPELVAMIETLGRSSNQTYRQQCRIKNAWGCEIGHCAVSAGNTALNLAERMNFVCQRAEFSTWERSLIQTKGQVTYDINHIK